MLFYHTEIRLSHFIIINRWSHLSGEMDGSTQPLHQKRRGLPIRINDIKIKLINDLIFRKMLLNFTNYNCQTSINYFPFPIQFIFVFQFPLLHNTHRNCSSQRCKLRRGPHCHCYFSHFWKYCNLSNKLYLVLGIILYLDF